jgi:maleylacetoacetate isomerase
MLKLYDYFRSSACYRVRIALNLKELDYQIIPVHLINNGGEQFSETYQSINPQSLVPSLYDGDKILTQSFAIIEYLDEVYRAPALLPNDPYKKALVKAFALSIVSDIHPLNNLRVLTYLKQEFNISEEQKKAWYQHWITKGFSALEKKLTTHNLSGDFCFGDHPSIADICLVPQIYNAKRFDCDLSLCPTLMRIDANCQKLPAFIHALPVEPKT